MLTLLEAPQITEMLGNLAVDSWAVRHELDQDTCLTGNASKQDLDLANEECRTLGHPAIDVGHLFLGLLMAEDAVATAILDESNFSVDDVRRQVQLLEDG
ncbi:MAG: hypothetical protein CMJ78_21905 [Planctomycetaceae bacterium]|nr:hypothetical protein [Planctomycetaceae bacterium]